MSETTEGKSVPDALRLIAQWMDEGKEVEYFCPEWPKPEWRKLNWLYLYHGIENYIFRVKPGKPRILRLRDTGFKDDTGCGCDIWTTAGVHYKKTTFVEVTDEVRAVLELEGLL